MFKGQVFFEIAVDTALEEGELRKKLRQAAYDKVQLEDGNNERAGWSFPDTSTIPPKPPIETDPPDMPDFIKENCLGKLAAGTKASTAQPVLLPDGSKDYYCIPDRYIICYHKFRLLQLDGSYMRVLAVHEGKSVITDLLIVLTYSDQ